jgi:hypothetical protein
MEEQNVNFLPDLMPFVFILVDLNGTSSSEDDIVPTWTPSLAD